MAGLSFADIEKEFDESLGYIKNDIFALCRQNEKVNYTVALLVACGCEVLAVGRGDRKRPHDVFAELLPANDWKALAKPLYEALRNGLAHKFDTKHLHVDGQRIQISFFFGRARKLWTSVQAGLACLLVLDLSGHSSAQKSRNSGRSCRPMLRHGNSLGGPIKAKT